MTTARVRRAAADVGFVVGGALLAASALFHWVRTGAGSTLRGHELIDTIASLAHGRSSAWVTALTLLWYAVPACGALAWIVVGFGDVHGTSGHAVAIAAVVVTATIDVFFLVKIGARAGAGVYIAATGALTLVISSVVPQTVDKSTVSGTTGAHPLGISRSS